MWVIMNSLHHKKWQEQSKQLRQRSWKISEAMISENKDQREYIAKMLEKPKIRTDQNIIEEYGNLQLND